MGVNMKDQDDDVQLWLHKANNNNNNNNNNK